MSRRTPPNVPTLPVDFRRRFKVALQEVLVADTPYQILRPADAEALISEEDFARDERLPYWAELWPSAIALAEHVQEQPAHSRSAIELGCGVGLVSACASRAGFEVTASDYYEDALVFCRANVEGNGGRLAQARHVDWRSLPTDLGTFPVIMAADVLYERPYGPLVAQTIHRLLARGGVAWLADPGRVAVEPFLAEVTRLGLQVSSTRRAVSVAGRSHDIMLFDLTTD
ncbi:MAG: methyltransferase domain-containing protein [Gemmatimonadaceae bacterium]